MSVSDKYPYDAQCCQKKPYTTPAPYKAITSELQATIDHCLRQVSLISLSLSLSLSLAVCFQSLALSLSLSSLFLSLSLSLSLSFSLSLSLSLSFSLSPQRRLKD